MVMVEFVLTFLFVIAGVAVTSERWLRSIIDKQSVKPNRLSFAFRQFFLSAILMLLVLFIGVLAIPLLLFFGPLLLTLPFVGLPVIFVYGMVRYPYAEQYQAQGVKDRSWTLLEKVFGAFVAIVIIIPILLQIAILM